MTNVFQGEEIYLLHFWNLWLSLAPEFWSVWNGDFWFGDNDDDDNDDDDDSDDDDHDNANNDNNND